jgi:hypothetical protein
MGTRGGHRSDAAGCCVAASTGMGHAVRTLLPDAHVCVRYTSCQQKAHQQRSQHAMYQLLSLNLTWGPTSTTNQAGASVVALGIRDLFVRQGSHPCLGSTFGLLGARYTHTWRINWDPHSLGSHIHIRAADSGSSWEHRLQVIGASEQQLGGLACLEGAGDGGLPLLQLLRRPLQLLGDCVVARVCTGVRSAGQATGQCMQEVALTRRHTDVHSNGHFIFKARQHTWMQVLHGGQVVPTDG